MPLTDFLTSIFTFAGDDNDITSCDGDYDICEAVTACGGNNPCEAAWQADQWQVSRARFGCSPRSNHRAKGRVC